MVLAMQHETLCAEHISVGYPRAGASLNTSHKPFTTWWGKLLLLQSPSRRLKYHCMPRHKPLERPAHVFTHNFCFFRSSAFFLLLSVVLKAIPASINLVNWASIGKLISVTRGNLILYRNTLSYVSFSCNYMCITRQQTLQTWKNTHNPF